MAAASANALQIVQTHSYSDTPNFSLDLTFNQFDDNSGAYSLNSIQVILTLSASGGHLILDNDGVNSVSGNWEFGAKGSLSSSDVSLLSSSVHPVPSPAEAVYLGSFNLAGNVGDGANDYDPSAPDGMQYFGSSVSDVESGYIGSSSLTAGGVGFLGSGTYDINVEVAQWLDYGSAGGIEFASTPVSTDGNVTVIYDYTATPEPTTVCLLSMGIVGLFRKRTAGARRIKHNSRATEVAGHFFVSER